MDKSSLSDNVKLLLHSQVEAVTKSKQAYRWDMRLVRLRDFLILPSGRTLQRYKNKVLQHAGVVADNLDWMQESAKKQAVPAIGYKGGIVVDEMTIQEDIQVIFTPLLEYCNLQQITYKVRLSICEREQGCLCCIP